MSIISTQAEETLSLNSKPSENTRGGYLQNPCAIAKTGARMKKPSSKRQPIVSKGGGAQFSISNTTNVELHNDKVVIITKSNTNTKTNVQHNFNGTISIIKKLVKDLALTSTICTIQPQVKGSRQEHIKQVV